MPRLSMEEVVYGGVGETFEVHFCESKSSSQQSRESYQADEYLDEEDTPLPFDMG